MVRYCSTFELAPSWKKKEKKCGTESVGRWVSRIHKVSVSRAGVRVSVSNNN